MVTPVYAVKGFIGGRRADTQAEGLFPAGFSAAFFIFPTIYFALSHFEPRLLRASKGIAHHDNNNIGGRKDH